MHLRGHRSTNQQNYSESLYVYYTSNELSIEDALNYLHFFESLWHEDKQFDTIFREIGADFN